ncbi:hypothetical protein [Microbulbifer yueqingensis]|uniref:Truncated hemoglobin YjbI n=1 Tax=Microbulbifer yueqingensis TaxID=658219 RepID=A0A1G9AHX3_9GAMM|nr:hypothetical protein [Microbulbifer yueqingensis]SDK26959.1 Truncated hemoglobin YjbI [Microbulbifer yueqingensis]
MSNLLEQVGGAPVVDRTVAEFYQSIGRHLSSFESCDHHKQEVRQSRFLNTALGSEPGPVRADRARFLARGLNRPLFEALLEFLQPRLVELGVPRQLSSDLVEAAEDLYGTCETGLSLAS